MAKLKVSEYIGLIKAGYTPEEIAEYEKETVKEEDPQPAKQPEKQPAKQPEKQPAEQPKQGPQPVTNEAAARIETAVNEFTKALQAFNLANARQPAESVKDPGEAATEILTKFCNM